jgi:hypothetical protein
MKGMKGMKWGLQQVWIGKQHTSLQSKDIAHRSVGANLCNKKINISSGNSSNCILSLSSFIFFYLLLSTKEEGTKGNKEVGEINAAEKGETNS